MIDRVDYGFGPTARNRLDEAALPGLTGAVAALETFYHAVHRADLPLLAAVWFHDDLTQVDAAAGGVVRSTEAILERYRRNFAGRSRMSVEITFTDAATYDLGTAVVFAGWERGAYRRNDGRRVSLDIRTSRVFGWDSGRNRWAQLHHHGSIDDPFDLADFQRAARL